MRDRVDKANQKIKRIMFEFRQQMIENTPNCDYNHVSRQNTRKTKKLAHHLHNLKSIYDLQIHGNSALRFVHKPLVIDSYALMYVSTIRN